MRLPKKVLSPIVGYWSLVRDERAGDLLENFFITAVVAILGIRLYLRFAPGGNLPTQVSFSAPVVSAPTSFHIAHMLWGGVFMLAALILLLTFIGRTAKEWAAVIGGLGFGTFIDELGKFITGDNNYFFQPAIALIYVAFVLLFVATRALQRPRPLPERDARANALELANEIMMGEGGPDARNHALELLALCDPDDPTTRALRTLLLEVRAPPQHRVHALNKAKRFATATYRRLVRTWWFPGAVIAVFILQSISSLYGTVVTITWTSTAIAWACLGGVAVLALYSLRHRAPSHQTYLSTGILAVSVLIAWVFLFYSRTPPDSLGGWLQPLIDYTEPGSGQGSTLLNAVDLLQILAPTASSILVAFGIVFLWHSRLAGYRMFHYAVLISVFVTQFFVFYENQIMGVAGLFPNLLTLIIIRSLIHMSEADGQVLRRPRWEQA